MLDSYFKISERGSSVAQEVRGGLVTFFTMAYIVALNPIILAYSPDANGQFLFGGAAPAPAMVAATTALVAGVLTILMGSIANYPLALATGLGLNTFVAVGIASKMTWAAAMGLVVLEGLIILVLVLTGFPRCSFQGGSTTDQDCNLSWYRSFHRTNWSSRCRFRSPYSQRTSSCWSWSEWKPCWLAYSCFRFRNTFDYRTYGSQG